MLSSIVCLKHAIDTSEQCTKGCTSQHFNILALYGCCVTTSRKINHRPLCFADTAVAVNNNFVQPFPVDTQVVSVFSRRSDLSGGNRKKAIFQGNGLRFFV